MQGALRIFAQKTCKRGPAPIAIAPRAPVWFLFVMDKIVEGIKRFRRDIYPGLKPRYDEMIKSGQKPHALIIGCSDSRVAFETMTGCGPGELFIVRNAGNIIPAYGKQVGGVTASIEFAVTALPIRDVIVCGHTHCGAMAALLAAAISMLRLRVRATVPAADF